MHQPIHRRRVLRAGFAAATSMLLPSAHGCEFFAKTLRIVHPWARATADDATLSVICMTFADVTQTDRLVNVRTPVARGAELNGGPVNLLIPRGQEFVLGETGAVLRLIELVHPLLTGREYPLELRFDKGGIVSASLSIDYERFN